VDRQRCNACNALLLSQEGSASIEKAGNVPGIGMARLQLSISFSHSVGSDRPGCCRHLYVIHPLICFCDILWQFLVQFWKTLSHWYFPQSKMCFYLPSLCLSIKDVCEVLDFCLWNLKDRHVYHVALSVLLCLSVLACLMLSFTLISPHYFQRTLLSPGNIFWTHLMSPWNVKAANSIVVVWHLLWLVCSDYAIGEEPIRRLSSVLREAPTHCS